MKNAKIAIAGLNVYDKMDLLKQLNRFVGLGDLRKEFDGNASFWYLSVPHDYGVIEFGMLAGPVLRAEKYYTLLLQEASCVVYVISAVNIAGREDAVNEIPEVLQQRQELHLYSQFALATRSHWSDIPWVWLLAQSPPQIEADSHRQVHLINPLINDISANEKAGFVEIDLLKGGGVDLVWNIVSRLI